LTNGVIENHFAIISSGSEQESKINKPKIKINFQFKLNLD